MDSPERRQPLKEPMQITSLRNSQKFEQNRDHSGPIFLNKVHLLQSPSQTYSENERQDMYLQHYSASRSSTKELECHFSKYNMLEMASSMLYGTQTIDLDSTKRINLPNQNTIKNQGTPKSNPGKDQPSNAALTR